MNWELKTGGKNIWGLHPMVWQYASKKNLWDGIENFPNDIDITDDVWLTPQIASKTEKIASLGGGNLYSYDRTNLNSIMNAFTAKNLCRNALACYRIVKMNQDKFPNKVPMNLPETRVSLMYAYCVSQVDPSLSKYQINLIRLALKDLNDLYPQNRSGMGEAS